jgi:hypothetical protein
VISTQAPTDADLLSVLIDDAKTGKDPKTKLFMYSADERSTRSKRRGHQAGEPGFGDFRSAEEVREPGRGRAADAVAESATAT